MRQAAADASCAPSFDSFDVLTSIWRLGGAKSGLVCAKLLRGIEQGDPPLLLLGVGGQAGLANAIKLLNNTQRYVKNSDVTRQCVFVFVMEF